MGDLPIIGHNVAFDVDFLIENGFDMGYRPVIDTFLLANFLYFDFKSLNLSNTVEDLGYIHEDAHRALSDVRATKFLFDRELEKLKSLSAEEYAIFASVASRSPQSSLDFIHGQIAPSFSMKEFVPELGAKQFFTSTLERIKFSQIIPIKEKKFTNEEGITGDIADTVLEKCDLVYLAKKNNLENRPEQFRMSGFIQDAFVESKHICIEAPTGVGKTFSYLVPAIKTALTTGKTVCVSTNTKTLQDQICLRDLPKVLSLLENE